MSAPIQPIQPIHPVHPVHPVQGPHNRSWPQARPCVRCGETDRCTVAPSGAVAICRTPSAWQPEDMVRSGASGEEYAIVRIQGPETGTETGTTLETGPTDEPPPEFTFAAGPPVLLDRVYRELARLCPLSLEDIQGLFARGFTLEEARRGGYWGHPHDDDTRSQTAFNLRKSLGLTLDEIVSVPGLWAVHGCSDTVLAGPGGLGIPVRDAQGRVIAARLRSRTATGDKVYRYLSGPSRGFLERHHGNVLGAGVVAAVHHARHPSKAWSELAAEDEVWVTEGELKADLLSLRREVFALSVPGVESWPRAVEALREVLGTGRRPGRVVLAFDADARSNPSVAGCLRRLAGGVAALGLPIAVALWPVTEKEGARGKPTWIPKGIDDALRAGALVDVRESDAALEALNALCASAEVKPDPLAAARLALATVTERASADPQSAFAEEVLDHASTLKALAPGEYGLLRKRVGALVGLREWSNAVRDRARGAARERKLGGRNANPAKLPRVEVTEDEERTVSEALDALGRAELNLYTRGPVLVRVLRGILSTPGVERPGVSTTIGVTPVATLRELLSSRVFFFQRRQHPDTGAELQQRVPVPVWAPGALRDRGEWPALRRLHGVVEAPVLRPDGSILAEPGYDAATGLVYEASGLGPLRMPQDPTREDALAAVEVLRSLVEEFPFKTEAHRAAWIALLLTPFARYAFAGDTPLGALDGNAPGAGKSRLVDLIAVVLTGRTAPRMAPSDSDEETRKRITSIALAGDPLVLIDNVPSHQALGGAAIDSALTCGGLWSDRILGASEKKTIPLHAQWFATGNNLQIRGDLARRVVHLRLESPEERPEERAGFKIQDLLAYAQAHRAELAAAALTILRAWVLAGRPVPSGLKPWGSFEGWARTVCAAVVWAGLADPGDTREAFREEADVAATANGLLLQGLLPIARKTGNRFTALQVLEELDRDAERCRAQPGTGTAYEELREALGELGLPQSRAERNAAQRLGKLLRSLKTRMIGGLRIVTWVNTSGKAHTKHGNFWKLDGAFVNSIGDVSAVGDGSPSYPAKENVFFRNAYAFGNGGRSAVTSGTYVTDEGDDYPRDPSDPNPDLSPDSDLASDPGEDYPRDPSDADGGPR